MEHAKWCWRDPVSTPHGIWTKEQVTEGTPVMCVHPAPAAMLRPVVDHVTALAERRHPVQRTVARIMGEMGTGQHHRRPSTVRQDILRGTSHAPPLAIAPA